MNEPEQRWIAELTAWATHQRRTGVAQETVLAQLEAQGIPRREALPIVHAIYRQIKPDIWHRPLSWKGIVLALAIFVGGNALLYGLQEWSALDDVRMCEALDRELAVQLRKLEAQKNEIRQKKNALTSADSTLTADRARLEAPDEHFSTRADFQRELSRFNAAVTDYNSDVAAFNSALATYRAGVSEYNIKVDRYNKLAKKAYSRFVLFPAIGSARAARSARRPSIKNNER